MRKLRTGIISLVIVSILVVAAGCTKSIKAVSTDSNVEKFLKSYNLNIKGKPDKFNVKVPKTWDVKSGDYPVGLYWRLANEFSKDSSKDLTPLKGTTVEVWRYSLADGLPGKKEQSNYKYPSNVILLIKDKKVVGDWLAFNVWSIGPSVKKRYLNDITGLTFEKWVQREKLFSNTGKNKDVDSLEPVEVLKTFFKAINDGDKARAYACLSPDEMLESLTMNVRGNYLYNSGFTNNNSIVEGIIKANPISFKLMDASTFSEIKDIGNRTEVQVAVLMDKVKWADSQFNTANGKDERFAVMKKYANGWKINGLGTGP